MPRLRMVTVKTADEWMRSPTWHGSYADYARHVRGVENYLAQQAGERLADKIVARRVEKLKGRR
jgi:hypothetical protein